MKSSLRHRKKLLEQLGGLCTLFGREAGWPGFNSGLTEEEFNEFDQLIGRVHQHNGWFVAENVRKALSAWGEALTPVNIEKWISPYGDFEKRKISVAIIGAGNIPLVALHDVLSVFISGNDALVKLSRDDDKLIPALFSLLAKTDDELMRQVRFINHRLENFDAVIATGSNNSRRYFDHYFGKYPHIIRSNRNSVAVLDGSESTAELCKLGHDIFDYFGLGCRNVTKLFVHEDFKFDRFFEAIYGFSPVISHNKYANNYDYNKAVWLLNKEKLLDNGFLLLKESQSMASPTASLFWEKYADAEDVRIILSDNEGEIQCVVGHHYMQFGSTQCPMLWDYADGADTLKFLLELK